MQYWSFLLKEMLLHFLLFSIHVMELCFTIIFTLAIVPEQSGAKNVTIMRCKINVH